MKKVSKLIVMFLIIMTVVSIASTVKAANADLRAYIGTAHNINGMLWEVKNDAKQKLVDLAARLDDATSDSIMNDIIAAENVVRNSGVTNHNNLSAAQQAQIVAYAQSAASKAGANLTVDLSKRTYSLTKNGKVILSGNIDSVIVDPGTAPSGGSNPAGTPAAATNGKKLLYTGSNYAVYGVSALAIVAVALVIRKKRA